MDFMVVPSLFFEVLYVLVIINHHNREIFLLIPLNSNKLNVTVQWGD